MKNILFLETIVFLIGGIILSLASGNPAMLAVTLGFDLGIIIIQCLGVKLVLMGEETTANTTEAEEDYSSYRKAHSL